MDIKTFFSEWLKQGATNALAEVQNDTSTVGLAGRIDAPKGLPTDAVAVAFGPKHVLQLRSVGIARLPPGKYKVLMLITKAGEGE